MNINYHDGTLSQKCKYVRQKVHQLRDLIREKGTDDVPLSVLESILGRFNRWDEGGNASTSLSPTVSSDHIPLHDTGFPNVKQCQTNVLRNTAADSKSPTMANLLLDIMSECANILSSTDMLIGKGDSRLTFEHSLATPCFPATNVVDIAHILERYPKLRSRDSSKLSSRLYDALCVRRQLLMRSSQQKFQSQAEQIQKSTSSTRKPLSMATASSSQLADTSTCPAGFATASVDEQGSMYDIRHGLEEESTGLSPSSQCELQELAQSTEVPRGACRRCAARNLECDVYKPNCCPCKPCMRDDTKCEVDGEGWILERTPVKTLRLSKLAPRTEASLTSAATTMSRMPTRALPRLPDLSPAYVPFDCPMCHVTQSFGDEKSWRAHAYEDLKAYICTKGGEACDSTLFTNRDAWFEHEVEHHRTKFTCILCDEGPFLAKSAVREHIISSHGFTDLDNLMLLEGAAAEAPGCYSSDECPFCDTWAEEFRPGTSRHIVAEGSKSALSVMVDKYMFMDHLAAHQEELAVLVLPDDMGRMRPYEDEGVRLALISTGSDVDENFDRTVISQERLTSDESDERVAKRQRRDSSSTLSIP
ncbi:hypothetical protein CI238_11526 [Colletotrichum incanum]|uniref:Oxidoreductase acuF-like C2H2 type zinc-finger domain-containing protein n=1 Tax=Colletotrichum incanum TaxID=1573173 RepID=A0A167DMX9_COLIC|nr:hypothetical protein CI238_11526 [Colletotrichum incanum]